MGKKAGEGGEGIAQRGVCWSLVGFQSMHGSLGQGTNGDTRCPESGAPASVAWMVGLVTQIYCPLSDRIPGVDEKGNCVDIVDSDLSEAFDLLPPDILIKTCIIRN